MTQERLPRALRWLLNGLLATLSAIGLGCLLVSLVQHYTSRWLLSVAGANRYWPLSWKVDYVNWLYSTYLYEALFLGLIGGLLGYWKVYESIRFRVSW